MEYKLIIKDYNGLYTIYLIQLCKVLIRVINRVIIVLLDSSLLYSNSQNIKELIC